MKHSVDSSFPKQRLLIFIPAYHAETTIESVVRRIPVSLCARYNVDVLIIDDSSRDLTFSKGYRAARIPGLPFHIRVLYNPVNLGYGGNQKIAYRFAIEHGYDLVAMIHGDGQYAPECLPFLLGGFHQDGADVVFGSRMLTAGGARGGGMPLYKFAGNKVLTWIQNRLLKSHLSEFHSGYRIYSVAALKRIPFERNSSGFHFDTEIIIQLLTAGLRIAERPIPTYYGAEVCRVDGFRYAADVIRATLRSRLQELGIFYDPRFDCAPGTSDWRYEKLGFTSPQTMAIERIPPRSRIVEMGGVGAEMRMVLRRRLACSVTRLSTPTAVSQGLDNHPAPPHNVVSCLDLIEHLE